MKRIPYILSVLLLTAAVSCEKQTDGTGATGTGNPEIIFPSGNSYMAGEDVIIICDGISPDASFWLEDASGKLIPVDNVTVTASGFFFTVTAAGEYTIVVEQDGKRIETGKISVNMTATDIIISDVPEYCIPGESFTISGTGLSGYATVYISDGHDGSKTELDFEHSGNNYITVHVPEDGPRGKFTLSIEQGGKETVISDRFFITAHKQLMGIQYDIATDMALYQHSYNLTMSRDEDGNVTGFEEYSMNSSEKSDETGAYTEYGFEPVSDESGYSCFRLAERNGQVLSASFETYQGGIEGCYTFGWEYDTEGYLSYAISNGSSGTIELSVTDGNISLEDMWIDCSYGDPALVNNPFGADIAVSIIATESEILRVALTMGFTGRTSVNLPTVIDGKGISYKFDEDGYVIEAEYTDPISGFNSKITYKYE